MSLKTPWQSRHPNLRILQLVLVLLAEEMEKCATLGLRSVIWS